MTLFGVLGGLLVLGAVIPLASRRLGRDVGYMVAGGFGVATAALLTDAPAVVAGSPVEARVAWIPQVDLAVSLRMDGLSLVFALLVTVVGAAVAAYAARYLPTEGDHGRLYTWLTVFAASMVGLVLADDLILLVVCWELTSVTSFVLVAGRGEHRRAATRALVTTTAGGLALLGAAAAITAGTGYTRLSQVLADPAALLNGVTAPAVIVLLIVAAATKSAQVPFHFWLPGAMVAPTPVSTYLHAATMVKAGVYLLLRFSPVFGGVPLWQVTLVAIGLATAVWGAVLALRRHDLKAILAYSTISLLGLLVALTGVGTPAAIRAVGVLLIAHAAYKATLFMVVGVVDHETGTRDIRELTGLGRRMPLTAGAATVAALSMAGVPPLLGFVGKEEALGAVLAWPAAEPRLLVVAAVVVVSVLTVAYSLRLLHGAFGGRGAQDVPRPGRGLVAPAVATAAAGVVLGLGVPLLELTIDGFVGALHGVPADGYLALWHGLTAELALSAGIVAAGAGLFAARRPLGRVTGWMRVPDSAHAVSAYDRLYAAVLGVGGWVARSAAVRAPTSYVAAGLVSVVLAAVAVVAATGPSFAPARSTTRPTDWVLVGVAAGSLLLLVRTRDRLTAALLLGVTGYVVALWFATLGAADLALTLLLVETLFVAGLVFSIQPLRTRLNRQRPRRAVPAACVAVCAGVAAGAATWWLTGRRTLSEPGGYFLEQAEVAAGGRNVVNTILVDFRALDTLGEIIVVVVAVAGLSVVAGWTRGRRST